MLWKRKTFRSYGSEVEIILKNEVYFTAIGCRLRPVFPPRHFISCFKFKSANGCDKMPFLAGLLSKYHLGEQLNKTVQFLTNYEYY